MASPRQETAPAKSFDWPLIHWHLSRANFSLPSLVIAAFLSGCSPARGYTGPELPREQLALIRFINSSPQVSMQRHAVDSIEANKLGIEMIPGQHEYLVNVQVKGPHTNCVTYKTIDGNRFNECLEQQQFCDCFNYLSVYQRCAYTISIGTCEGNFQSAAGQDYRVTLGVEQQNLVSAVSTSAGAVVPGGNRCAVTGQSSETAELFVGTGHEAAVANGFSTCP